MNKSDVVRAMRNAVKDRRQSLPGIKYRMKHLIRDAVASASVAGDRYEIAWLLTRVLHSHEIWPVEWLANLTAFPQTEPK